MPIPQCKLTVAPFPLIFGTFANRKALNARAETKELNAIIKKYYLITDKQWGFQRFDMIGGNDFGDGGSVVDTK